MEGNLKKSAVAVIGKAVTVLHFQKQKNVAAMMAKHGLGSVSYGFLAYLKDRSGITQRELCSILYVDDAIASRAMGVLVEKGFVKRQRSKADARSYELYLTDKGREILPELLKMYEEWWKKIAAGISGEKMAVVSEVLRELAEKTTGHELYPEVTERGIPSRSPSKRRRAKVTA